MFEWQGWIWSYSVLARVSVICIDNKITINVQINFHSGKQTIPTQEGPSEDMKPLIQFRDQNWLTATRTMTAQSEEAAVVGKVSPTK